MHVLAARHPEIVYMQLSRNFGKEAALTAGLEAARGQVVVCMDADLQHPPTLTPRCSSAGKQAPKWSMTCAPRATTNPYSNAWGHGFSTSSCVHQGACKYPKTPGIFVLWTRWWSMPCCACPSVTGS